MAQGGCFGQSEGFHEAMRKDEELKAACSVDKVRTRCMFYIWMQDGERGMKQRRKGREFDLVGGTQTCSG
jgi:hypothetical protein